MVENKHYNFEDPNDECDDLVFEGVEEFAEWLLSEEEVQPDDDFGNYDYVVARLAQERGISIEIAQSLFDFSLADFIGSDISPAIRKNGGMDLPSLFATDQSISIFKDDDRVIPLFTSEMVTKGTLEASSIEFKLSRNPDY